MRWCRVGGARRDSHSCRGKLVGRVLVAPWFSVASCCRARSTGRDSVLSCCAVWSSDACQGGSPRERTLELRGKRGLDSGAESFVELSCLGLGRRGVRSAFLAQTRQSIVSLPLSALVPEPRSGVRSEAAAWPGYGVACVVCSVAALSRPCAGTEAGARLVSRACELRVPLLAASGGGLFLLLWPVRDW
ncbi:hypothetical protein Taro_049533 [Colocasia esculenta]|uniref:Uncharacterized protein n=1 Tax=Colocasia esculenta TaxID=4460 RepID=A0A843XB80_COLES|nr:hypothetical protein [Colocasia esculenta]